MRAKRLKALYQDLKQLNLPETQYVQHKTGQVVLTRNCKRFYRKLAKHLWKTSKTLVRINSDVLEQHKQLKQNSV